MKERNSEQNNGFGEWFFREPTEKEDATPKYSEVSYTQKPKARTPDTTQIYDFEPGKIQDSWKPAVTVTMDGKSSKYSVTRKDRIVRETYYDQGPTSYHATYFYLEED